MDVQRFFKVLIKIESRLAELYGRFSEVCAEDPEASACKGFLNRLLALRFENSAAENHMEGIEVREAPGLSRLLKSLGREDRKHYSDLPAFARKRGVAGP